MYYMACLGLAIDGPGGMQLMFIDHDGRSGGYDDQLCFAEKAPTMKKVSFFFFFSGRIS